MARRPLCPECGSRGYTIVKGRSVYSADSPYAQRPVAICRNSACDARTGVHIRGPNAGKPMGRLAGAKTRRARSAAHRAFDPLWLDGRMEREEAYAVLAAVLRIPVEECHIGLFDVATCQRVIAWARQARARSVF